MERGIVLQRIAIQLPGYDRILQVLKKTKTEEDKELLEWVGEDYNPEMFDLEDTNIALNPKNTKIQN